MPVDRERVPGLLLQRAQIRAGARDDDHGLRVVTVEQATRDGGVAGIGHLGPDGGAGAIGRLGKRRGGAGYGDYRGAGRGEGGGDPTAQAPAGAYDDRGPAR